jgi:hypothetical protein
VSVIGVENEAFEYIRTAYRVPARRGQRVRYAGRTKHPEGIEGTILGAQGAYVMIRLDDEEGVRPYHPTWALTYLPMG